MTLSDSNVDLYAKVEKGFWVTYDSDGGSYVAPEFYPAGETAELSAQPKKNGYSFEGWYDGNAEVTSTTKSVSVKAKWKENSSADYRVIYWQQKVTDDKNAMDAQKNLRICSNRNQNRQAGNDGERIFDHEKLQRIYEEYREQQERNDRSDGSTIMNVYYDRVLCTVNYYVRENRKWNIKQTVTGLYGANLKEGRMVDRLLLVRS